MPNYDYKCSECRKKSTEKHTFEEHDRRKRVTCPKCGSENIERVIGAVLARTSKES